MKLSAQHLKLAAALVLTTSCSALNFIKMSCSQLTIDRIDPLVEPGTIGSAHLHQLVGGNALNATMHPTDDYASQSTCTSCLFLDDSSNYWTPVLYYQARNGSYKRVKQLGGLFYETSNGGVVIYYFNNRIDTNITPFPKGFRMRHGDPAAKGPEARQRFPNITHTCMDDPGERFGERVTDKLPTRPCKAGILTTFWMPQCWDGKNLDSPDHASHVSQPEAMIYHGEPHYISVPKCPASHPVQIAQIVMETRWDTSEFNTEELWGWRGEGKQPFVWSSGDREGWALHMDYVFGWKDDSLTRTFATACDDPGNGYNCANLTVVKPEDANKCTKTPMMKEEIDGWVNELPGGIQAWESG